MTSSSSSTASLSCCLAATRLSSRIGLGRPRSRPSQPSAPRPASGGRGVGLGSASSAVDGRRGRPALDPLAELDQGQLVAGDLVGQPLALLRVRDLHQLVGVGQRVLAQRHELAHLGRRVGEAEPVLEVALVLAQLLGEPADAVAVLPDHAVVHRRLVEGRDVLALEVLDDRDLERGVVVDVLDEGGDRRHARRSCDARQRRSPAISWKRSVVDGADEDGLEDAVLADATRRAPRASPRRTRGAAARGLDSMRSTGITLTPVERWVVSGDSRLTIAGGSSRSSESRRAAAARKSGLAKFDHLPGELAIGAGGLGRRRRTT